MDIEAPEAKGYLKHLYQITEGKTETQVSMFEVGEAIGLDRESAGKVAENLIGFGLVEVKTLSGGIGITSQGIDAVKTDGGAATIASDEPALNSGPLVDEDGRQALDTVLNQLRDHVAGAHSSYAQLEEVIIDLKTIEVQLLSPQPKTAIIREVLKSLETTLKDAGSTEVAERLRRLAGQ